MIEYFSDCNTLQGLISKLFTKSDHSGHDVAAKSQRVLEDALIRNIQLQKDLARIGEEVARLQKVNKELEAKQSSVVQ